MVLVVQHLPCRGVFVGAIGKSLLHALESWGLMYTFLAARQMELTFRVLLRARGSAS